MADAAHFLIQEARVPMRISANRADLPHDWYVPNLFAKHHEIFHFADKVLQQRAAAAVKRNQVAVF